VLVDLLWMSFSFLLGTYFNGGNHIVGCEPHAADALHWCILCKLPVKNNILVVYVHVRLTVNNVLKGFLKNRAA
jgi:hypothetical protein